MARWRSPDLTDAEHAALEAIDLPGLPPNPGDLGEWHRLMADDGWYGRRLEQLRGTAKEPAKMRLRSAKKPKKGAV